MEKPTISVDEPAVSEVDCVVCSQWPEADREAMRLFVDKIPLKQSVCDPCQMAFWQNCIVPLLPNPAKPTKH